jgi:hypothetical protein
LPGPADDEQDVVEAAGIEQGGGVVAGKSRARLNTQSAPRSRLTLSRVVI